MKKCTHFLDLKEYGWYFYLPLKIEGDDYGTRK